MLYNMSLYEIMRGKTNMKNIKFAIVGLWHLGKRHAEIIRQNSQARLVAVCYRQING